MENVPHWIVSKMLSHDLDGMGFSRKRVQERQLLFERNSSQRLGFFDMEHILAGSLREGVGFLFYNDIDILEVDHNIICETNVTGEHEKGKTVLQIDENGATPGYCFLNIVSVGDTNFNAFQMKLWMKQWMKCPPLPNSLFTDMPVRNIPTRSDLKYCPLQGPSVPIEYHFITTSFGLSDSIISCWNFKSDNVLAFPCKVDHILQEWRSRERSGWPEAKVISEVMTLPTYVVPVGAQDKFHEWRISFVMAEIHLVKSFNDTQTKVYVLMKIITKRTLKPLCEDITSYVVKNVMFWLCEKVPRKRFKPNLLIHRLRDALKFLKSAIEKGKLPNYMIPKRNLFKGKLNCDEQTKIIINFLNNLVKYTSCNFYKQNTKLPGIEQEDFELKRMYLCDIGLTNKFNCFLLPCLTYSSSLHLADYMCSINFDDECKDIRKIPQYEFSPLSMFSPYPYLLAIFLHIPMRLFLMNMLPQEMFISDNKYLLWTLLIIYLVLFIFIQKLHWRYLKFKMIDFNHIKRPVVYSSTSVIRLEKTIVFIYILSFTVILGFTDLTFGINLPFMCLCLGLFLLCDQIKKFGSQLKVIIPNAYTNVLFQMRVLFPLLFAITMYVLL